MTRPLIPALAGSLLLSPAAVFADSHETQLDTVVVSATRSAQSAVTTPSAITIITREEIEASGARNVVEVLRGQPGIQIHDYFGDGSRAAIGMRGFGGGNAAHNTLVLVDGRRMNNIDLSAPALSTINLDDIERIEIVQGSAGALFGDMAVGGVINIITRGTGERRAEGSVTVGSFAHKGVQAALSRRGDNGFGVRMSGQFERGDGYRERNAYDRKHASLLVDYNHDAGRVFAEYQAGEEYLELAGALNAAQLAADRRQAQNAGDFNDGDSMVARIGVQHTLTESWNLEAELTHRNSETVGVNDGAGFNQWKRHTMVAPRLVGTIDTARGELLATIGVDLHSNAAHLNIPSYPYTASADQDISSIYGQAVIPVSEKVNATIGLRRAKVDGILDLTTPYDDTATARELGVSYQARSDLRVFARLDENFRFPKSDELGWTTGDGLETQTGLSKEIGLEWSPGDMSIAATAYRINLDNEIGFSGGYNVNLPATRRDGMTLNGSIAVNEQLTFSGSYSYTDAVFTAGTDAGNRMPMVAKHTARLTADFQIDDNWSLVASADHVSDRILDDDAANTLPTLNDHTLFNLTTRYSRGPWRAVFKINNLLNSRHSDYGVYAEDWSGGFPPVIYDAYYPTPERSWRLTVGYDFE